jgi:Transposase
VRQLKPCRWCIAKPASLVHSLTGANTGGAAASTVRAALRQMGVDEIHIGKKQKFLTVVCNLETGEPLWFGRERKKETPTRWLAGGSSPQHVQHGP